MKYSIKRKLTVSFGLCVLMMLVIVGFNFVAIQRLENFFQKTLKRSADMVLATDAQHIGQDLDMVITDAALCGDLAKIERDWAAHKAANLAILQKMHSVADTSGEYAGMQVAEGAFNEIIRLFEQDMLPFIKQGTLSREAFDRLHHRLDQQLAVIDQALGKNKESMANENRMAERDCHAVLLETTEFGLAISLLGVFAALAVSALTTKRIVRPLAEVTSAVQEITKENYPAGLKYQADDEIGALINAFRDMSEQVKKRTSELQTTNAQLQREIGERTLAEEEVFRLNAELEQRVKARTTELIEANHQLNQVVAAQQAAESVIRTSQEQLRHLTTHQQSVREEERTRISREVHDELGQGLTALKMDVSWLGKRLRKDQTVLSEKTGAMMALIDTIIKSVQRIAAQLRPGMLDDLGLEVALEWELKEFQKRTGIACEFICVPSGMAVDLERSTAIFRIFQEALTNIARHAQATRVAIHLEEKDGTLTLIVQDNGQGISVQSIACPDSLGLLGIRERVRLLGGEVDINGHPNAGTIVRVTIPLAKKEEE
jgi:signal transduction histidine kinase